MSNDTWFSHVRKLRRPTPIRTTPWNSRHDRSVPSWPRTASITGSPVRRGIVDIDERGAGAFDGADLHPCGSERRDESRDVRFPHDEHPVVADHRVFPERREEADGLLTRRGLDDRARDNTGKVVQRS